MKRVKGKTTFKPLKGGKFRCNQTNEIVKAGRTDSYRRVRDMNLRQGEIKAKKQAQARKIAEKAKRAGESQQDSRRTRRFGLPHGSGYFGRI